MEASGAVVKADAMTVAATVAGIELVVLKHRDQHSWAEVNWLPLPPQPPYRKRRQTRATGSKYQAELKFLQGPVSFPSEQTPRLRTRMCISSRWV